MDSIPTNLLTFVKHSTKLNYTFGMVMANLLAHIWNLQISFPDQDIALHANNFTPCF